MENKKEVFLVTGSSGFIGHALCHHFAAANHEIVGFDRVGPPDPPPPVDCLFCDLTSDESVQKTFHIVRSRYGNKIKAVFHLAAYYSFSGEDSPLYKTLTVDGTDRLMRELQSFEVGQFIFSSSMLVHKPNKPGHLLTEDSPTAPNWQYPRSKVETEKLLKEKHGKIPIVILRIAGVYDNVCHSIPIAHQIQRIYEKQLEGHLYPGNTNVRQSFVHVADLVKAYDLVVQRAAELPNESLFLIGEPDAMSYEELQQEISHQLDGADWTTFKVLKSIAKAGAWVESNLPMPEKPFIKSWMIDHADDNFEVDISKARSVLGWEPSYSLRKMLAKMIEGLKVDPKRWYQINKLHFPHSFLKFDLTNEQTIFLRKIARKNWAFFKTFVGQEDNWLPIDNFQEHPEAKIAHRTSPTNIGYGLLANLAAYDFGYIASTRLIERVTNTFNTMDLLEKYRGHFYNWYDTQSLKSLKPIYISTVDSGNLASCLLTLREALLALADKKIIDLKLFTGLQDTLTVLNESIAGIAEQITKAGQANPASLLAQFQMNIQSACQSLPNLIEARAYLEQLTKCAKEILASVDDTLFSEVHWWAQALCDECSDALSEVDFLLPWISFLQTLDRLSNFDSTHQIFTIRYLADLESSSITQLSKRLLGSVTLEMSDEYLKNLEALIAISSCRAKKKIAALEKLSHRSSEFAQMKYEFLFDKKRGLLAIGYNLSEKRLDSARYDLLASEARLCYFVAIAQGQISKECWFTLGRNLTMVDGEYVLLSWNGSMLEYLMPLMVMPAFDHTLLSQTYQTAVKRQIEYGNQRGVPWGISACCYNSFDDNQNYQYAAFGVPELGLKHGLADDLVIAPHATALALMVAPEAALQNLQRLSLQGFIGKYGFYEAIDYTPARVPSGQSHVIVRSFMAHHQGMTLLSLSKSLLEKPMQELFELDPNFQAIMPLLQEPIASTIKA